ncbi:MULTISPECIES: CaiB/BaiF CoA-transferase family protein [unclassified Duganella]|uniref:CaiB/BaiF CoA transferase family protein n=1 Tax=unclassified Duganella TaxID=2636909 RepID=UPI000E348A29|nr:MULTISPECIES: CoA transferase [unclassified Duganella]RFP15817.1 CoA transferase [Duganella sp. BJB475]RFP33018.1 CoA transferase [Duganella sp. BJB476]
MSTIPQASLFTGLKVVDLASFIAGPAATTILSDFGADVIKVEPPGLGDPYRYFYLTPPNPACETNYAWQLTNRNKRSIALDLKSPAARRVLHRLVRWADVLVTNFPPKVRKALGLTYEELAPLNDRLIYADITGYGLEGPEADKPGFDITAYWARTGLMEVTHDADSPPTLPIPGIGDHATAVTLYSAIVTGLYRRTLTGKGGHVSTSLIAEGAWAASTWIEGALHGAKFVEQHDRKRPSNALLNPYRSADQRWLLLVAAQEKDWPGFVQAMRLPQLLDDPRFATKQLRVQHAADLVALLDPVFASQPLAHWRTVLDQGRVIFGVVQTFDEIVRDPQMIANDILVPLAGPHGEATHTVNSPMQLLDVPKVRPRLAPELGQHSVDVLQELEFSAAEIAELKSSGAVVAAP